MILRILDEDELSRMNADVRRQIKEHLNAGGKLDQLPGIAASKKSPRRNRPEQEAGKALVEWFDLLRLPNGLKPGLFFVHTPNGGFRNPIEAAIFYGQGVRKAWPDYTLYLPRHQYHGAVMELKAEYGAKPDAAQLEILARLETVGYKAMVAWGFDDARKQWSDYLDIAY